jgi:beta-mannanase
MFNWEPMNASDQPMSWASIARGDDDASITAEAHRLSALPEPVYVSFSHEPELNWGTHGTAADFASAFRHVVEQTRAAGASNVLFVWDLMGLTDPVWAARYKQMWPGDAYVSWVAWDPYNWATCRDRRWKTFAQTVQPFYAYLEASGFGDKPFMLAEYGTVEDATDPSAKAAWLTGISSALRALPDLKALLYFDLPAPPANCDWLVSSSSAAQTAYDNLARAVPFAATAQHYLRSR